MHLEKFLNYLHVLGAPKGCEPRFADRACRRPKAAKRPAQQLFSEAGELSDDDDGWELADRAMAEFLGKRQRKPTKPFGEAEEEVTWESLRQSVLEEVDLEWEEDDVHAKMAEWCVELAKSESTASGYAVWPGDCHGASAKLRIKVRTADASSPGLG